MKFYGLLLRTCLTEHFEKYHWLSLCWLTKLLQPMSITSLWILTLHKKFKFSIKDFFSKCDQIRKILRIWSHLLKKSLMENFIFLCSKTHTLTHEYHIRSFLGSYFAAFGLNTEICFASLCTQSECGKKRTKKIRIRTLFTQWSLLVMLWKENFLQKLHSYPQKLLVVKSKFRYKTENCQTEKIFS